MSEVSILSESIPANLVEETQQWTVFYSDGATVTKQQTVHLPKSVKSPYDLDLSQFLSNQTVDLPGFVDLVKQLIADDQARKEILPKERVLLIEEYQPDKFEELGDEVITYKLIKRMPANMSRDGKSRPNRTFSHAYDYVNPHEPNHVLSIEARPIDHVIEFAAWAKTAQLANARALWLERLLVSNRWLFTSRGVNPFNWKERGTDTLWTPSGTRLHQRPMQFTARLREYIILAYPTIREFELDINTQE